MKKISKQAERLTVVTEEDMTQINALSRGALTPEEVYTFGVRLCDNQTDRDFEYFSRQSLESLAALFVGKTGIFDHTWSAAGQTARIYRTELVEDPENTAESGEPGCYLKGYAYMLRTDDNASLIAEIEGGIKKEVSVSCAVARTVCSICGNEVQDRTSCPHVKGQIYEGKRCIVRLEDPTDAYEWSFVAVPAQPKAGVVKGFRQDETPPEDWQTLQKDAEIGRRYLTSLRQEIVRLGLMADADMGAAVLRSITEKLESEELESLRSCYEKRLQKQGALPVQLHYEPLAGSSLGDNGVFAI